MHDGKLKLHRKLTEKAAWYTTGGTEIMGIKTCRNRNDRNERSNRMI